MINQEELINQNNEQEKYNNYFTYFMAASVLILIILIICNIICIFSPGFKNISKNLILGILGPIITIITCGTFVL